MYFHDLHPSIPTWLSALDSRLSSLFAGEFPLLQQASQAMVGSQGKRLRPMMLLLACASFGEVTDRAVLNGCMVELIHTASLVHDDVVDEADLRRGEPSARARWDNKFSILLGDFFLARVFELAARDGDPAIWQMLAPTAAMMGRGVILELSSLGLDADEQVYWQVVHGKTASLFAAATGIGALIGGASTEEQQACYRMGEKFGYAFQLTDDLLDLQGNDRITGKPNLADWRQRRATLPVLYAMRHAPAPITEQIRALWSRDPISDDEIHSLRNFVESAGGLTYSWELVHRYLSEARQALEGISPSRGRKALLQLCSEAFPLPVLPAVV